MTIPVYAFTGFLESGKTALIKETLLDPGFNAGEKTLLLLCETGVEEYDDAFLSKTNTTLVDVQQQNDLTYAFLKKCDSLIEPDRVMIEFNGTWNFTTLLDTEMPFDWLLVQILSTLNAATFQMYINNMRSMLLEQLLYSETIIINRCDDMTDKLYLRNNIKAINKKAQLIYESNEGKILTLSDSELPFDCNQEIIDIQHDDYGLWYMDAMEHPYKYENKTVIIRGKVIHSVVEDIPNAFVLGRYAIVCCADDMSLIGLLCYNCSASALNVDAWISVNAVITVEIQGGDEVPVLHVTKIESIIAPEDEDVYFN